MPCTHKACLQFFVFADAHCYRCHYSKSCTKFGQIEAAFYENHDDAVAIESLACDRFEPRRKTKQAIEQERLKKNRSAREIKRAEREKALSDRKKAMDAKRKDAFKKKKFCPCGKEIKRRFPIEQRRAKYCDIHCAIKYGKASVHTGRLRVIEKNAVDNGEVDVLF